MSAVERRARIALPRGRRPLRSLVASLALVAAGCAAFPVEDSPSGRCGRRSQTCRATLVVGFFPSIGEAHLNGLATNGKPLTPGLRVMDFTLRPLFIAGVNVLSLGFPTVASWLLEPYEGWDMAPGRCGMSLLGYCKAGKNVERDADPVPPADADRR
jgi:hypothetical protein